ncbi:MAG TPA: hypothetical protein VHM91_20240, partial [Verrucomicrobiales bacterium]|nr:hypothetical protein [Verrucomicrobiales bacterium]
MTTILKLSRLLLLSGLACLLAFTPVSARQPSLAASIPEGAIGFIEVSDLGELVRAVRTSRALEWALSTDEFHQYEQSADYRKAVVFRITAELLLGSSLWDVSAELLSGRLGVALYPNPDHSTKPRGIAVLHFDESKTLGRVRDALITLLSAAGKKVDTKAVCPGALTWTLKDQGFVSLHRTWIVASQERSLLDRTLSVLGNAKDKPATLATQESFAEMDRRLGDSHHARAWVDTALIAKATGERFGLPQKFNDGFASFIFGGLVELAGRSRFAGGTLDFRKNEVEGTLAIAGQPDKLPEPYALWFTQHPANGVIALPDTSGAIAGITL